MKLQSIFVILFMIVVLFGCAQQQQAAVEGTGNITVNVTPPAAKIKPDQPSDIQRVFIFAKPAVVFVKTDIEGDVTLPEAEADPYTGSIRPAATTYSRRYRQTFFGSGFIVSPSGYIITNAHVVGTDRDVEKYLLDASIEAELETAVTVYAEENGIPPSREIIAMFNQILSDYVKQYGKVENEQRKVTVIIGANVPGVAIPPKEHIANVRKIGDSDIGGLDLALLKVEQNNLPTVKLGDSDKVQTAAQVYAVGYPGIVTLATGEGGVFSIDSITEPTLTSGIITSRRVTNKGISVMGIDASIKGGNSGGPSLDSNGDVIGVNTFGFTGGETYNFILPSNLVRNFVNEAGVVNMDGPVDRHYKKGLEYYWDGEYVKAKEEMEIVKNLYPGHPYVHQYLTLVQERLIANSG